MALRTSVGSGDWDVAGTWDTGVPVDGDTFAIAAGHTVNFNVDQSGMANGMGASTIAATGKLNVTDDAGDYILKMSGVLTVNGTIQAGTSTSVPFTGTFKIDFDGNNANIAVGSTGVLLLYCDEPTYKYIKLNGGEPIAETVLAVDTDVTADIWAAGDTIYICDVGTSGMPEAEVRVIDAGGIAAGTITITAGLTAAKADGAYVVLRERNIKITNNITQYIITFNAAATGSHIGAELYTIANGPRYGTANTIAGTISDGTWGIREALSSTVNSCICDCTVGTQYGYNTTFSDGIIAGCGTGSYDNISLFDTDFVIAGCTTGLNSVVSSSVLGLIDGCSNGANCFGSNFQAATINNCNYCIFGGTTSRMGNCTFSGNNVFYITNDAICYNCSFTGTEFNGYNLNYRRGINNYVESFNHDQVENAYKAWCLGGIVTSQTTSPPTGYTVWYQFTAEDTTQEATVFRQYQTTVLPGTAIEVTGLLRNDEAGLDLTGVEPFLAIADAFADPLVDSTQSYLDIDYIPEPDADTESGWQAVNVIWANQGDAPRQVIVRMVVEHDGGGDDVVVDGVWAIADYQDQIQSIYDKLPSKNYLSGSDDADGGLDNEAKADINTEADTALTDYDPPTRAELTTDKNTITAAITSAHTTTDGKIDVVDGIVDAILIDTNTTIPALIAALNDPTAAAIATAVWNTAMQDLAAGAPSATASVLTAINYIYEAWRNKTLTTGTEITLHKDDGTTELTKSTISDDGTTFTKGEYGAP